MVGLPGIGTLRESDKVELSAVHQLQLAFDSRTAEVSAWYDGNPILEGLRIDVAPVGAGCQNPPEWTNQDFKYAGVSLFNPPTSVKVDNFAIRDYLPGFLFTDGFESGDLSKWSDSDP